MTRYERYDGKLIREMPKLIGEGRKPLFLYELMCNHPEILSPENYTQKYFDKEKDTLPLSPPTESHSLFATATAFVDAGDGERFKVVNIRNPCWDINDTSKIERERDLLDVRVLRLTNDCYEEMEGEHVFEFYRNRVGESLRRKKRYEAREDLLLFALADGEQARLDAFLNRFYGNLKKTGYNEGMPVQIPQPRKYPYASLWALDLFLPAVQIHVCDLATEGYSLFGELEGEKVRRK